MAWHHEGSRHDRGYGYQWTRVREVALMRDGWLCQRCLMQGRPTALGVVKGDHAVDHIIPKAQDGSDDLENLQSLCIPCHEIKNEEDKRYARQRTQYDSKGFPIW